MTQCPASHKTVHTHSIYARERNSERSTQEWGVGFASEASNTLASSALAILSARSNKNTRK